MKIFYKRVIFALDSFMIFLFFKSCKTLSITVLEVPKCKAISLFVICISFALKDFKNYKILLSRFLNFISSTKVVKALNLRVNKEKIIF